MSERQQHDSSPEQPEPVTAPREMQGSNGIRPRVWIALAGLFLLALAVIFVLPGVVERYELPLVERSGSNSVAPAVQPSVDDRAVLNTVSPFQEAQRARLRREAQDVLASLLERQEELEAAGVEDWAAEPHADALQSAREGDEQYRNQDFQDAIASYTEADDTLARLQERMPGVFDRLMTEGRDALRNGEAERAEARFRLALRIDPESSEADAGLSRAGTLDEVLQRVERARRLQEEGRLEEAETQLEEALALDNQHGPARDLLEANRERQREREFTRVMSRGFALLNNNESEAAIEAFREAQMIRPGASQPDEAIQQAREQMINARIAEHRSRAQEFEQAEQWEQAIAEYEQALELDANLVFATEGLDYARRRHQLDQIIEQALADPARLGEQEIYEYTQEVYETAASLEERGPRLQNQLESLGSLLDEAREPVQIGLRSDNRTHVTVYQVGELGTFESMSLELRPGRYVAVGTRPGYRDVRREFLVGFGNQPGPITIACDEQVLSAGQR